MKQYKNVGDKILTGEFSSIELELVFIIMNYYRDSIEIYVS